VGVVEYVKYAMHLACSSDELLKLLDEAMFSILDL